MRETLARTIASHKRDGRDATGKPTVACGEPAVGADREAAVPIVLGSRAATISRFLSRAFLSQARSASPLRPQ